jgi:phosphinothricin acetyltransferase
LVNIYNHYVERSHCTFDVNPFTTASRTAWFQQFVEPIYQCLVACQIGPTQTEEVIGYACSMPFRSKPAYFSSVEMSIYITDEAGTQGVGTHLYTALFKQLKGQSLHRAYAGITLPNEPSISLHEKFGFTKTGHFHEVGYKFDRYWDVAWFEKRL